MDQHIATELAYKNGYAAGKKDAEKHGTWLICSDGYYPYCSECKSEPKGGNMTDYCPSCGARMDGDKKE